MSTPFGFPDVRDGLAAGRSHADLHSVLDRDYRVLTYLARHSTAFRLAELEDRLLVWDYRLVRCWYFLSKAAFPDQTRRALAEMADVLALLVSRLNKRIGVTS